MRLNIGLELHHVIFVKFWRLFPGAQRGPKNLETEPDENRSILLYELLVCYCPLQILSLLMLTMRFQICPVTEIP